MLELFSLLVWWRNPVLLIFMQEPVTLLEYSMNAVTEGIDAIATTRVLIRADSDSSTTTTRAVTGETVLRTFRYDEF